MMNKCAKFHKESPSDKKSLIQYPERHWTFGDGRFRVKLCIIGSAEALPILCVRCARWERERERDTEREREKDGNDVTLVTLKLAMSLHFSLPKIRTFRFSLHTSRLSLLKSSPLLRWNSQWVHTFRCQNISPSLFRLSQMARAVRRVTKNPNT